MINSTDQEMMIVEKIVCYSQFTSDGGPPNHRGHTRKPQGRLGGRERRGPCDQSLHCGFCKKKRESQGKQVYDLNDFSGPWNIEAVLVVSCLALGD